MRFPILVSWRLYIYWMIGWCLAWLTSTVYPKKYAHGFVVLCFVVVMQSFIMNSHEVFIHIHQGCFAGTGAIVRLPQCQWSKPDGYGKISQCITTTKHSKAKTVCIFLGIYCKAVLISPSHLLTHSLIFAVANFSPTTQPPPSGYFGLYLTADKAHHWSADSLTHWPWEIYFSSLI